MNEILKQIKDYPDYAISNLGNVYSYSYKNGKVVKLSPGIRNDGYLRIGLYKNGKRKQYYIHRLVAEAFIPNPLGLPEVNHINEIKSDNRAENLEWCSRQYNTNYGTRNEKVAEKLSKQVEQYDLNGNLINVWKSVMEIERCLGFDGSAISKCCRGYRYKTAYGYIWKYIN
jgi:hypothetical protein